MSHIGKPDRFHHNTHQCTPHTPVKHSSQILEDLRNNRWSIFYANCKPSWISPSIRLYSHSAAWSLWSSNWGGAGMQNSPENISPGVNFLLLRGAAASMQSLQRHEPRGEIKSQWTLTCWCLDLEKTFSSLTCSGLNAVIIFQEMSLVARSVRWRCIMEGGHGSRKWYSSASTLTELRLNNALMIAQSWIMLLFYLSCNIFSLNLKWSPKDFSLELFTFFLFLFKIFGAFDKLFFVLTAKFESLIVVLWDLSWLVAFKSLISSEGFSLLKDHVS